MDDVHNTRPAPPPDLDQTLAQLCSPPHVQGAIVLTRDGYILRALGHLFQDPVSYSSSSTSAQDSSSHTLNGTGDPTATTAPEPPSYHTSGTNSGDPSSGSRDLNRRQTLTTIYAKQAKKIVDTIQSAVDTCQGNDLHEGTSAQLSSQTSTTLDQKTNQDSSSVPASLDPLRFLRIRTSLHELLITPDPKYILVLVQDPPR